MPNYIFYNVYREQLWHSYPELFQEHSTQGYLDLRCIYCPFPLAGGTELILYTQNCNQDNKLNVFYLFSRAAS